MADAYVDELIVENLTLLVALDEAITEYQDAIAYKSEYLVEKHKDLETIAELQETLNTIKENNRPLLKHIQADAIEDLRFPVELRKMWSGAEVQQWIEEQACQKRK